VLAARPAFNLHYGDFWRTVWHFLITHKREIDADEVASLIDFLPQSGMKLSRSIQPKAFW